MKIIFIVIGFVLIVLGFLGGNLFSHYVQGDQKLPTCALDYEFINDTAGCKTTQKIQKHLYLELVEEINTFIAKGKRENNVNAVSVYFRDLQLGPTFGIDEKSNFAPASLLKVPLLLAYLSLIDSDKELLNRNLSYRGNLETFEQTASSGSALLPSKKYSIEYLLERMIIYSDNGAYTLLFKGISNMDLDGDRLQQTMIELGLVNPDTPTEDTISVKSYSSLFRQLYNASYLSPETSEYALKLLSRSDYENGIAAGVAPGILVAHKFGERATSTESEKQLHDCGIVYYPDNPYLLCIMTKGNNFIELEQIISKVSRMVYEEVDSRKL